MIAKLIAHGDDREQAIARCLEALRAVTIEGIHSNASFLARTLEHPAFAAGDVHTGFVEAHRADLVGG
jgi:3-methylcrotonyl-CoA carboxylase alpha subunit